MNIQSLHIEHFRNIAEIQFSPGPGTNVIFGDNAQGKTNLLEAIWLFCGARSFRGAKDSELIPFGGGRCALELEFFLEKRLQTASIVHLDGKRAVHLNEVRKSGPSALAGHFCAVVFSPDHLSLIKDGPQARRSMIDAALCQAYPKYGVISERYEKSLRQRNRLLKDAGYNAGLLDLLPVWDRNLIEYGAYITQMRARYVAKLGTFAGEIYDGISLGKESFSIRYLPSFGGGIDGFSREDYKECIARSLQENRSRDLQSTVTTVGPHRDDIEIQIEGMSARAFGSQGQQRSCVLAVKLAECRILEERSGEAPVVLLDDVMSELDENRRGYLLNHLDGRQVIITCCDVSAFSDLQGGRVFEIRGGALI